MSQATVTAALIVIGNEILSGRTKDVNVSYLARQLTALGIQLAEVRMVRDEERAIIAAVNTLRASHDYVFTTGGIGPTHDDITSEAVARAFNLPYRIHPEAEAHPRGFLSGHRARAERGADAHGPYARGGDAHREPGEPGAGLPGRERPCACRHPGGDARDVRERGADAEGRTRLSSRARSRCCWARATWPRGWRVSRNATRPWRSAATPSSATATSARRWSCAAPTKTEISRAADELSTILRELGGEPETPPAPPAHIA